MEHPRAVEGIGSEDEQREQADDRDGDAEKQKKK
jgi:hypothetical protein